MKVSQRKLGTILSYLFVMVNILSSLIYTPIMLRILGQSEYGLYQLAYSIISYLSLLSLGFTSSYMRFYSRYKVKNDEAGIAQFNGMYLTIFMVIAAVTLLAGSVMIKNARMILGTGLTGSELKIAKILMAFMVFNMALSFPQSVFSSIVSAHEEFIFQRLLSIAAKVLNPFITLPLLLLGYGSIGMVLVTTILTIADFLCQFSLCRIKLKTKFCFKGFKFVLIKELGVFTFWIFLMQIVGQLNNNLNFLLLGRMVGTKDVAIFGVGYTIYQMYQYFPSILATIFTPQVNLIVSESNDNSILSEIFIKIGRIQYLILGLILTGFIFFGKPFVYHWSGVKYLESYYVAVLLMASATIPFTQNIGIEIQTAKNKHQIRSVVYIVIAIINVLISIPLIKIWGVIGTTIGTALALIFGNCIFMNIYYSKKIGLDITGYWKNIFAITISMVIPSMFGVIYNVFVKMYSGIWELLLGIVLYTIIYCIAVWYFGMNDYEKQLLIKSTSKVINLFPKSKPNSVFEKL